MVMEFNWSEYMFIKKYKYLWNIIFIRQDHDKLYIIKINIYSLK